MNTSVGIDNLDASILDLMLQSSEIQKQQHDIRTSIVLLRETLEKCQTTHMEEQARQITEKLKDKELYLKAKKNHLKVLHKFKEFLEFVQSQQRILSKKKIGLKIDIERWKTEKLSTGPEIIQDTIATNTDSSTKGYCLRILVVDLGDGDTYKYRLVVDGKGEDKSSNWGWQVGILTSAIAAAAIYIGKNL